MPILMYDNDIGFGYGGKVKFVDYLGKKESFDLILFNSSKGERWYVFTFSMPDLEIRQGKTLSAVLRFQGRIRQVPEIQLLRLRGPDRARTT